MNLHEYKLVCWPSAGPKDIKHEQTCIHAGLQLCHVDAGLVRGTAANGAQQGGKDSGLAGGAIAGIVAGVLAACVLASALGFVLFRGRKRAPTGLG